MNKNSNNNSLKISNILNKYKNDSPPSIEECKKLLSTTKLMPMFSIKNIVAGATGTVIPWTILLIIVGIIIII